MRCANVRQVSISAHITIRDSQQGRSGEKTRFYVGASPSRLAQVGVGFCQPSYIHFGEKALLFWTMATSLPVPDKQPSQSGGSLYCSDPNCPYCKALRLAHEQLKRDRAK